MIITIDGPAGSGKSTVAKEVAKRLKLMYLDSGSLYRAFAWYVLNNNIKNNFSKHLDKIKISYEVKSNKTKVKVNNKNVSDEIRKHNISIFTSKIAAKKEVRKFITKIQRQIAEKENIVLEGRDSGTVVFPNADFKFYLSASIKERARRRWLELAKKGEKISFKNIYESVKSRDKRDKTRKNSPLVVPKDAKIINSTTMTINEVVRTIITTIKNIKR